MRRAGFFAVLSLGFVIPSALFADWANFIDQTATRLSAAPAVGSANPDQKDYAWGDVDKDGDIDLVSVQKQIGTTAGTRRNVLFMNENGVLVDRTNEYGSDSTVILQGGSPSQGLLDLTADFDVVLVDVNGDTWPDIVTAVILSGSLGKAISHPRVYINKKDNPPGSGIWQGFIFDDENRVPTMPAEPRFLSVSAGDIDNDGDQDLYLTDMQQGGFRPVDLNDRLWINDGNGYFIDESTLRMTSVMLESSAAPDSAIADMNGDGRLDIVKADTLNAPQAVSIAYNNISGAGQDGFFNAYELVYQLTSYHISIGDLNNDNRLDVVLTDDSQDRYLLNQGNGADLRADFNSPPLVLQGSLNGTFGGNNVIADLDNDGLDDALVTNVDFDLTNCVDASKIFHNLGNTPNVTLMEDGNLGIPQAVMNGVHDFAVFDLNSDNWNDIIVGMCDGTRVYINQIPVNVTFTYPQGLPDQFPPDQSLIVQVQTTVLGPGGIDPDSGLLHYAVNNGPYSSVALTELSPNLYEAAFPPLACLNSVTFYFSIESTNGGTTFYDPPSAAAETYSAIVATSITNIYADNFESSGGAGWTDINNATIGKWELADPIGTLTGGGLQAAPEIDAEPDLATHCFITANGIQGGAVGDADVDGGPTDLFSPMIDLEDSDAVISYAVWFFCDDAVSNPSQADQLIVSVSSTGGEPWVTVETIATTNSTWELHNFRVSDFVTPTSTVQVRFRTQDSPSNSITEAGVDIFRVDEISCSAVACTCLADLNSDGQRDGGDVQGFVDCLLGNGSSCGCADMNGSTTLDETDVDAFVGSILNTQPCS